MVMSCVHVVAIYMIYIGTLLRTALRTSMFTLAWFQLIVGACSERTDDCLQNVLHRNTYVSYKPNTS